MAIKFLKGTSAQYNAATKNNDTFYFIVDEVDNGSGVMTTVKNLYLGDIKLSNAADLAEAVGRIATNEGNITTLTDRLNALVGSDAGSLSEMIAAAKKELQDQIGTLTDLKTDEKTTLVGAINELADEAGAAAAAAKVTLEATDSADYAKVYTLKQGGTDVGVINIPKDMVVKSGEVVVNPEGQAEGTYIVITLANATEDKIYVNVGRLVDIYTVEENATQVQLAIVDNKISATIVAGSIGTAELADAAVVTAKIADKAVTLAKLDDAVQASLAKADTALQAADITEGSANGTIAVKGADVKVKGLGSAAFAEVAAFDAAGSAAAVQGALNEYKTTNDTAVKKNADDIAAINHAETGILAQAKADATTKANTAEGNAKSYADTQIEAALSWSTEW